MGENEGRTGGEWARIIIPRILSALVWGLIMGGEMLIFLHLPHVIPGLDSEIMEMILPEPMMSGATLFFAAFMMFEVAIRLLKGTVFPYILGIARAILSIILLVQITNCGIITLIIPSKIGGMVIGNAIILTFNFQKVLGAVLLIFLIGIVKNMLQAVYFMSQREELGFPKELP